MLIQKQTFSIDVTLPVTVNEPVRYRCYITIRVKPTFVFAPYFEHHPHFLHIYSEMRTISPKTIIYQNDCVDETVVLVPNDLDMICCP